MSCIAVNLHEVKQDRVRIQLTEKLLGKNGPTQTGKFYDLDQQKLVTQYCLPTVGIYEVEVVMVGTNITPVCFTNLEHLCQSSLPAKVLLSSPTEYWSKARIFFHSGSFIPTPTLSGFQPNSVLDCCYISYRRVA